MSYKVYTVEMTGMPTPRPRMSKWGVYTPASYKKYLKELTESIQALNIPAGDYISINVKFWFTYPKSTPKRSIIEGAPHRKKFDCDNLLKGLLDAMSYAGIFHNDSQLSNVCAGKFYTTDRDRIEFELFL